jgi:hypothetical protein
MPILSPTAAFLFPPSGGVVSWAIEVLKKGIQKRIKQADAEKIFFIRKFCR